MTLLTPEEIGRCEERLSDPRFCNRLLKFQGHIYRVFDEYRTLTDNKYIRFVYGRPGIKSLESVVTKINWKRETNPDYNLESVEDFAGIKVVCSFKSSAIEVMNWMLRHPTFDIEPKLLDDAWVSTKTGYRGWHFTATPSRQLFQIFPIYAGAKCEIQVKTMLQEAWDAQTHEVSYKSEKKNDRKLLKQLKIQSDILSSLDEQSESLRELIQESEEKESAHRNAAAAAYLYLGISTGILEQATSHCHVDLNIADFPLNARNLSKINKFVEHYTRSRGVDKDIIRFIGYIALNQCDAVQEEMAITRAQDFLSDNLEDPFAEDTVAGLYWSLNRLGDAIAHEKTALKKANEASIDTDFFLDNYCYWLAESVLLGRIDDTDLIQKIFNCSDQLYQRHFEDAKYLDTAAFVKIILGSTHTDRTTGLELLERAKEIASKNFDAKSLNMANAFYEHHKKCAEFIAISP